MKSTAIQIALLCVACGCTTAPQPRPVASAPSPELHVPEVDISRILPPQDPSRYWRLRSLMSTADVEAKFSRDEWMRGMRLRDLTKELGSVPLGTLDTIVFALADGTFTCDLNRNYLQSWQIRKDQHEVGAASRDGGSSSADPHRNAYFRAQSYVQHVLFLKVPLTDVHGAIRRAERATYSDLVGHHLEREHRLFTHGCACKWCRRPVSAIKDPDRREAARARHSARSQALHDLAKKLDAQGITPPSHLKPLVLMRTPSGSMKLYIPLEHIEQAKKAEQAVAPATSKPAAFQATASEAGER